MKLIQILTAAAALIVSGSTLAAEPTTCSAEGFDYRHYEIFFDVPTRYVYVKTPCGWHFVRQIEAENVAKAIEVADNSPLTTNYGELKLTLLQSPMK